MKHIFFDLDRTLWDFEKNSENALKQIFENYNFIEHIRSFSAFHSKYKKINSELWNLYGKGKLEKPVLRYKRFHETLLFFNIDDIDLAKQIAEEYVKTSPYQTILFPGAHQVLDELKNNGYQLHIITNGFKEVQHIKLQESKLTPYFDVIVCSEETGKTKPAKEVFDFALKKANANPKESIMIGDDYRVDVLGAERFGMPGILFDPHQHHKFGTHPWHIKTLGELPGLLPWIEKSRI